MAASITSATLRVLLGAGLVLGAAACGGGGAGSGSGAQVPGYGRASTPSGGSSGNGQSTGGGLPAALQGKQVNDHGSKSVTGMSKVEVTLGDFYFDPTVLVGRGGQTVTLELSNTGSTTHTFTLAAQNIDQVLGPGQSAQVTVTFPDSGSTLFECTFHAGQGMRGALVVHP